MAKIKFFVSGYEEIEIDDADPNQAYIDMENAENQLYEKYKDLEELQIRSCEL